MSQRALTQYWTGISWVSDHVWIRYLTLENITVQHYILFFFARSLNWWHFVCGFKQKAKSALFLYMPRSLTFPMYLNLWSQFPDIYCKCIPTIHMKKCTKIPDQWVHGHSCPVCGLELLLFFISAWGYRLESKHHLTQLNRPFFSPPPASLFF